MTLRANLTARRDLMDVAIIGAGIGGRNALSRDGPSAWTLMPTL